jgi:hypothetical protein
MVTIIETNGMAAGFSPTQLGAQDFEITAMGG